IGQQPPFADELLEMVDLVAVERRLLPTELAERGQRQPPKPILRSPSGVPISTYAILEEHTPISRFRRSVNHNTSTAPDSAASTLVFNASRSTSSASSMVSSRGAWVTPMRTSTSVLSVMVRPIVEIDRGGVNSDDVLIRGSRVIDATASNREDESHGPPNRVHRDLRRDAAARRDRSVRSVRRGDEGVGRAATFVGRLRARARL